MTRPGLRAALALLTVFGAGVVTGIFVERHHSVGAAARFDPHGASEAAQHHQHLMRELREAVDLDDDQVAAIERIVAENRRVVHLHWEELRPEVQQTMERIHQLVADELRPEQRRRYHEWLQAQRRRDDPRAASPPHHPATDESPEPPEDR